MMTSPPLPPSPPEGPPRGTYFSRRNATQPLPPSPPFTMIFASSANTAGSPQERGQKQHTLGFQGKTGALSARNLHAGNSKYQSAAGAAAFASLAAAASSTGKMLMKRPSPPLSSNFTKPVVSAKRVSSLARPTFLPGL